MITLADIAHFPLEPTEPSRLRSGGLMLLNLGIAAAVLAAASVIEYLLFFRLGVRSPSAVYLVGIVMITAWGGTGYGIFAALASVLLCDFFFLGQPFAFQAGMAENLTNAFLFLSTALLVGLYADLIRQRLSAVHFLVEAGRGISGPSGLAGADALGGIAEGGKFDWRTEGENIAVAFLMVACGCVIAWGMDYVFHAHRSLSFFVAAVLITAMTRGARAALFAAIAAVVVFNAFFSGRTASIQIDTVGDLVNLFIFSAVAWWVGTYTDHVRHGRRMAQNLFEAGQFFSAMNSESAIRRVLHKTASRVCNTSSVWVLDETGTSLGNEPGPLPPETIPVLQGRQGDKIASLPAPWRALPLVFDGRSMGTIIWFGSAVPRRNAAVVEKVVAVLADLASGAIARARLAAEQSDMQLVAQAEKLRTALLSSISHDFRTPLSGILGAATGLLELGDQYDRARRRDLLVTIRNQALRLNRYVENLLSMIRLENGALNMQPEFLVLEPLLYDTWEALGDHGGSLRMIDVRIQEEAFVFADKFLFTQVLTNLFENAIKYTPEGSTIIVRGRTSGRSQVMEIVDSGPGVPDADLANIFGRFYRGQRPGSLGLGLGLYITKGLLDAMGATVEARNRMDGTRGLIISISMPVSEKSA